MSGGTIVRSPRLSWLFSLGQMRNSASRYIFPMVTSSPFSGGFVPYRTIRLVALRLGGEITTPGAGVDIIVTVWKNNDTGTSDECFKITKSCNPGSLVSEIDESVNNSGMDIITPDDGWVLRCHLTGTTTVDNVSLGIDYVEL